MHNWRRVGSERTRVSLGRICRNATPFTLVQFASALLIFMAVPAGLVQGSEAGAKDEPGNEFLDVMGKNTALVFTETLIAPQFYNGELVHHIFYEFALLIDTDGRDVVINGMSRLREVFLDELNKKSFAFPGAPKRINLPLLKRQLLIRARELFGEKRVKAIYVMNALPGNL